MFLFSFSSRNWERSSSETFTNLEEAISLIKLQSNSSCQNWRQAAGVSWNITCNGIGPTKSLQSIWLDNSNREVIWYHSTAVKWYHITSRVPVFAGEPWRGSCLFFIIGRRRQNLSDVRLETCAVSSLLISGVFWMWRYAQLTMDACECTWNYRSISSERKDRIKEVNFYIYVVNCFTKYLSRSWTMNCLVI